MKAAFESTEERKSIRERRDPPSEGISAEFLQCICYLITGQRREIRKHKNIRRKHLTGSRLLSRVRRGKTSSSLQETESGAKAGRRVSSEDKSAVLEEISANTSPCLGVQRSHCSDQSTLGLEKIKFTSLLTYTPPLTSAAPTHQAATCATHCGRRTHWPPSYPRPAPADSCGEPELIYGLTDWSQNRRNQEEAPASGERRPLTSSERCDHGSSLEGESAAALRRLEGVNITRKLGCELEARFASEFSCFKKKDVLNQISVFLIGLWIKRSEVKLILSEAGWWSATGRGEGAVAC
ncbi:hypothetical protein EYF80_035313 [Liparis tanakae]|uniref:Uncharacterized protein n=1 Tax=Liparis tanakae TaxID=230148 RepID=A0A4Z2GMN2_9TELE|nr:hypothetical protein EYF80_035313 [Liparis tanakae]